MRNIHFYQPLVLTISIFIFFNNMGFHQTGTILSESTTKRLSVKSNYFNLGGLVKNRLEEDTIRTNFNVPNPIVYPPLTITDGLGIDFPKPPAGHPRLFLREKDIPTLKAKINDPLLKNCWEMIVTTSNYPTDGLLDPSEDGKSNFRMSIINSIEAKALMYVLFKDSIAGRNAVNALLNFFKTVHVNPSTADIYRIYGRFILTNAIVYDWCYPLVRKEEKNTLIKWAETMASRMEIGWPVIQQGAITTHASELQLMRDILSAGIATYDEKKEMYLLAAGRFFKYYIPARQFFYHAGFHHQGSSYGITRFVCEMWPTYIFDRMGYPEIFGADQGKLPYMWTYLRRPDGQYLRDGDNYLVSREFGTYWENRGDALAGFYYRDPILIGEAIKQGIGRNSDDSLFDFLFFDSKVLPINDKSTLPLTRYFKEPFGTMIARTGWEEGISSKTVVALMKVGVYNFVNHQHLDAGNFQIYYKGPLAVESGIYQGTAGGYGCDHHINYYQRTIAHNSMLIYDPDEKFSWHNREIINDGGQQFPNNALELDNLELFLAKDYKTGEVLAHGFGPDSIKPEFTYLKGELKEAYSEKVKSLKRSFVFLNLKKSEVPAALIVFDRVSASDKNFKKYWLLHCVEEPLIEGNVTTIGLSGKGYSGKMVNTTLLPVTGNLAINKTGGKGKEYSVFGKNFTQAYRTDKNSLDGAAWRIEVTPKTSGADDSFLNIMQVMDNKENSVPFQVTPVNSDQMTGAMIADRVVLFSKSGDKIGDRISFSLVGKGMFRMLITDLKEGYWMVEKSGQPAKVKYLVDKDDCTLYFIGKAGKYFISR